MEQTRDGITFPANVVGNHVTELQEPQSTNVSNRKKTTGPHPFLTHQWRMDDALLHCISWLWQLVNYWMVRFTVTDVVLEAAALPWGSFFCLCQSQLCLGLEPSVSLFLALSSSALPWPRGDCLWLGLASISICLALASGWLTRPCLSLCLPCLSLKVAVSARSHLTSFPALIALAVLPRPLPWKKCLNCITVYSTLVGCLTVIADWVHWVQCDDVCLSCRRPTLYHITHSSAETTITTVTI